MREHPGTQWPTWNRRTHGREELPTGLDHGRPRPPARRQKMDRSEAVTDPEAPAGAGSGYSPSRCFR